MAKKKATKEKKQHFCSKCNRDITRVVDEKTIRFRCGTCGEWTTIRESNIGKKKKGGKDDGK